MIDASASFSFTGIKSTYRNDEHHDTSYKYNEIHHQVASVALLNVKSNNNNNGHEYP